ncbi:MAG TPA: CehA/McbA family metallohydrolase [Nocardioidaceae bacterium]|nr:CehA/McbA family metallohydrolase [Nocardioidaceae bacterium]
MTNQAPADYRTLDLSEYAAAGPEVLGDAPPIAGGLRTFRGIPFQIESTADRPSFVLLEPGAPPVDIAIGQSAQRVVVAHLRLADPSTPAPELGDIVAEYTFDVEGQAAAAVPIRERFEVAGPPDGWNWQGPFLAVVSGTSEPLDRRRGAWGDAGVRQTEAPFRQTTTELFLWTWTNPDPDSKLTSIRLESRACRLIIAAITLGTGDEDPFVRDAAVPVRVTAPDTAGSGASGDWTFDVDRGLATYAYPLPEHGLAAFLDDPLKGWGEAEDSDSSRAYARVAAVPSATLSVGVGGEALADLSWRDITATGSAERDGVRVELVEPGRNWVHVRVLDADTGSPVPCRVHFRSLDGVPYQPHGHHDHVNSDLGTWHIDVGGDVRLGRLTYAYIDGTCQGWLPVGDVAVDVARGFEYEPLRQVVHIRKGQRELELRLKRWTSMNDRGWYSGDSHVHFLSAQGALTEQQGEDLNVVNLLQSQWGSLFTNTEDFTGRPQASEDGQYVTWVSQENRQHMLGHLVLWGLKRPVMPWCTDGLIEAEHGGALEATESDWADQCHEQGGTVVIPHFPLPNGEPATLIANGRADAVEMIFQHPGFHREYYRYLNGGYRLPLVGGTDKMSSDVPVGLYRTYVRLGDEPFSYDAWRSAVVAGRTFLSGGPLLSLKVDGADIGDTVRLRGPGTVSVEATAESVFPISTLEIVRNGEVVCVTNEDGARRLELAAEIAVDGDCWLAARCGGPSHFDGPAHRDVWGRGVFAHTSPVYVATQSEEYALFDAAQARYMLTLIEGSLGYIRDRSARYPDSHPVTHHHGEPDHLGYLERPFLEAQAAIQSRLDRDPA